MSEEIDRPPAGTACAPCKARNHFCPATHWREDDPVCLWCLDDVPCAQAWAIKRMESDEPPPGRPLPEVRHIDPASVEIPPEVAAPEKPRDNRAARAEAARMIRDIEARRKKLGRPPRTIVRPAPAEPRPEIQPEPEAKPEPKEEAPMAAMKTCAYEGCTEAASPRGSYCSKKHYYMLKKELAGGSTTGPKRPVGRPRLNKHPAAPLAATGVTVEPPPAAAADGVFVPIHLRLSEAHCDALYLRCTPEQKAIAIAAALQHLLATTPLEVSDGHS